MEFLCLWATVSIRRLLQVLSNTSILPIRFSTGLFVSQGILYQSSFPVIRLFAKDNVFSQKIRLFLLAHCCLVFILPFCLYVFFLACFFTVLPSWNWESESVVVFSVSGENKFEVDTTSISLSYLCHFRNVIKELFRYC